MAMILALTLAINETLFKEMLLFYNHSTTYSVTFCHRLVIFVAFAGLNWARIEKQ